VATLRDAMQSIAVGRDATGLVPTMGYLHDGHTSLIRRARVECEVVAVSIFVNPRQFGPGEDLATYPRDLDRDLALLAREHADIAFVPEADFYPPGADSAVVPGQAAEPLEGAFRPGHFRGMATVVAMLFNAIPAGRAYFGEKDWQQLQVVRRMARDLHMPVEIMSVATVREQDGLAMSSRNVRLAPADRAAALCVPRALGAAQAAFDGGETNPAALESAMRAVLDAEPRATVDYAVVVEPATLQPITMAGPASRALIAARIGTVRLIDNCAVGERITTA
jgi:pantoate--beta-alanine ligase